MNTNLSQSLFRPDSKIKRWFVDDTRQIQTLLNKPSAPIKFSSLEDIFKSIVSVEISDTQIRFKLNKDLIIESPNQIFIADNLNVQIAKQIHLNPNLPPKPDTTKSDTQKIK